MSFKVGDKVKTDTGIATVILVPGMKEYDKRGYLDAERGMVIKEKYKTEVWTYQYCYKKLKKEDNMSLKVGDKVKAEDGYPTSNVGIVMGINGKGIVTVKFRNWHGGHDGLDYGNTVNCHGSGWFMSESYLTKLSKKEASMLSIDELSVGDVLVNDGDERTVLAICGKVACLSLVDGSEEVSDWWTAKELNEEGWKLKDEEEPKEMTVAEISEKLGYEVKVVKD